jgi:glycerol-3-phosphate cytidylyltransferase
MDREVTMRIGYAAGAFDLFHVGHVNLLRQAKQHCDVLIAGVVSDEMLREVKGIEPVIPTAERAEIVRHLRFVDHVHVETTPEKLDAWRELRFTHFFKGDDWRGTPKGILLEQQLAGVGVEVRYLPYTVHTSSTALRRALAALDHSAPGSDTALAR